MAAGHGNPTHDPAGRRTAASFPSRGRDYKGVPLARTAEDCALLLDAIVGPDPDDVWTTSATARLRLRGSRRRRRGAWESASSLHLMGEVPLDPRVGVAVETALVALERLGAQVERVDAAFSAWLEVSPATGDAPRSGRGAPAVAANELADYGADVRALAARRSCFCPSSAPISPASALGGRSRRRRVPSSSGTTSAAPEMPLASRPRIGEDPVEVDGHKLRLPALGADPLQLALEAGLGVPTASVPARSADGLPVGLALTGRRLGEATRPACGATPTSRSRTGMSVARRPRLDGDAETVVYTTHPRRKEGAPDVRADQEEAASSPRPTTTSATAFVEGEKIALPRRLGWDVEADQGDRRDRKSS